MMRSFMKKATIIPVLLLSFALASCGEKTKTVVITIKNESGEVLKTIEAKNRYMFPANYMKTEGLNYEDATESRVFNHFFTSPDYNQRVKRDALFTESTTIYTNYIDVRYEPLANKDGNAFRLAFKRMNDSLIKLQKYGSVRFELPTMDVNPDKPNTLLGLYDHAELVPYWNSASTWNREHIWPCSKMVFGTSTRPEEETRDNMTDIINIRACTVSVNEEHGNKPYGENQFSFNPTNSRGETARVLMYMESAYGLELVNYGSPGVDSQKSYGDLATILKWWAAESTPSQFEINRQDHIEAYQNNRNPFVDEPLLAHSVYDIPVL